MCESVLSDWDREVIETLWGADHDDEWRQAAIKANRRILREIEPEFRGLQRSVAMKRAALQRLGVDPDA